ncbi:MAG: hypothetical protein HY714_06320 [Candidatus Omnitrophica bacterium]|nr:hypothetical protein [Candidatus Omnitrophota bacterium]
MSLRAFHILFIVISVFLAAGFGVWAVRHYQATRDALIFVLGAASLVGSVLLAVYLVWFISKTRKMGPS